MLSCQSHFTLLIFHSLTNINRFCDLYQFAVFCCCCCCCGASELINADMTSLPPNIHHSSVVACDALTSMMSLSPWHFPSLVRRRYFHTLEYQRRLLPSSSLRRQWRWQCALMCRCGGKCPTVASVFPWGLALTWTWLRRETAAMGSVTINPISFILILLEKKKKRWEALRK